MPWSAIAILLIFFVLSVRKGASVILICALLIGSSTLALRELSLAHGPLRNWVGKEISFSAVVTTDPTWGSAKVRGAQSLPASLTFIARVSEVTFQNRIISLRTPVRVMSRASVQLIPGTSFRATARLSSTRERKVAALFILTSTPTVISSASVIQRTTTGLRHRFSQRSEDIAGDSGTLIPGLVLGDTSRESASFISVMRRVGLTHLTAVSGENFSIIAATLLWIFQWFIRRHNIRILLTAIALIAFIFLVRPSPSVLRASVMTGVLLMAKVKGSRADALASLGFAIGLLILLDPFQALDAGFALSVAATAGILLLAPKISSYFQSKGFNEKLSDFIAIPISATALCSPIIIAISGQLSPISIPVNLIVSLAVAPITICGFVAALLPWDPLAHLLLVVVNPCAHWISWVARKSADFPVLSLPRNVMGLAIILFAITCSLKRKWKLLLLEFLLMTLIFFGQTMAWPGPQWRLANCDVGQGDAMVINLGDHQGIVIDVGPDSALMQRCLRDLKIKTIPLLVLTHFHADHVGGLSGVLKGAIVKSLWISPLAEPAAEYQSVMNQMKNVPTAAVHEGQILNFSSEFGPGRIKVIWPSEGSQISGINNSSIALFVTIGNISIFASGDIEPPAQEEIVAAGHIPDVDILKVAHHGSAYQDSRLYQELRAEVALISVGAGNSYGHPSRDTVAGLRRTGARVFRTDIDGAISIDASLRIRANKKAWWKISWG